MTSRNTPSASLSSATARSEATSPFFIGATPPKNSRLCPCWMMMTMTIRHFLQKQNHGEHGEHRKYRRKNLRKRAGQSLFKRLSPSSQYSPWLAYALGL